MKKIIMFLILSLVFSLQADAANHKFFFGRDNNLLMPASDPALAHICWYHLVTPGSFIVIEYGPHAGDVTKAFSIYQALIERLTFMKPCRCVERDELQSKYSDLTFNIRVKIVVP